MASIQHIAIIPDGNRRWAKAHGKPAVAGHTEGAKTMQRIIESVFQADIPYLTVWGSSVSNLTKRSAIEVAALNKIFEIYFLKLAQSSKIHKNQVRVRALGRWKELLKPNAVRAIEKAIASTREYAALNLTFLLGYSGIEEMLDAIARVTNKGTGNSGSLVGEEVLKANLWTHDLPAVDLVIRTGGEPHWSGGFMMWDVAEAQLAFTETLWPAFAEKELLQILDDYKRRERRLGA